MPIVWYIYALAFHPNGRVVYVRYQPFHSIPKNVKLRGSHVSYPLLSSNVVESDIGGGVTTVRLALEPAIKWSKELKNVYPF